ncbi:hypothetical protein [Methylobacterium nonmethylotrophicum]|uniref:Uncharacterized protein n=1 Tax=Methylobacterium nonmethylotrophicum TaxID=1141884 RepID=A0A4Z0NDJ0_9HYPH|nr:hypothetical protein [Methylobacterium nonmethylotrophicum]TGD93417.1 hypothetical protein EU555_33260 [Methylobacterium nonmethylotrophicum]
MLDPPAAVWVGLIGLLIGTVEIVARYKGDPRRALLSAPALLYITVNVLACLTMLACLRMIEPDWLFSDLNGKPHLQKLSLILSAGFGAMTLFRSSLFRIKTADGELGIGPSFLLDTLLFASDRAIDRSVALPRGNTVKAIMKDVSFERAKVALPVYCFALMQNVPSQEQQDIGAQVKDLAAAGLPPEISAYNLGLLLMNAVGAGVLAQGVRDLSPHIGADPLAGDQQVGSLATLMQGFDFGQAQQLAEACISLGRPVSATGPADLRIRIADLSQETIHAPLKALILGRWLVDLVGYSAVKLAMDGLRTGTPPGPAAGPGPADPPSPQAGRAPTPFRRMLWQSLARRRGVREDPSKRR